MYDPHLRPQSMYSIHTPTQGSEYMDVCYYNTLTDYQKVSYLLTQTLLIDYYSLITGYKVFENTRSHIEDMFNQLPYSEYMDGAYQHAYNTCKYVLQCLKTQTRVGTENIINDVLSVFMHHSVENIPSLGLSKELVIPLMTSMDYKLNDDDIVDGSIEDGVILEPKVIYPHCYVYDTWEVPGLAYRNAMHVCILPRTSSIKFASFDTISTSGQEEYSLLQKPEYKYITGLNWSGKTLSQFVAFMSQYSIEHDLCSTPLLSNVCYDIVTHSNYTDVCCNNDIPIEQLLKYLCERWGLTIDDNQLLADLLSRCGYDVNTLNYLVKDTSVITAAEADAFNKSFLSKYIKHRIGLEASDVDQTLNPVDESSSMDNDMSSTPELDDTGASMDDPIGEDTDEEITKLEDIDRKVPVAVDGIILELLDPTKETMADHLYRAEFQMRVKNLVQNASTTKCSKYTLYLLTQWATKWLYICSVTSLKSFLENISFPLMSEQIN